MASSRLNPNSSAFTPSTSLGTGAKPSTGTSTPNPSTPAFTPHTQTAPTVTTAAFTPQIQTALTAATTVATTGITATMATTATATGTTSSPVTSWEAQRTSTPTATAAPFTAGATSGPNPASSPFTPKANNHSSQAVAQFNPYEYNAPAYFSGQFSTPPLPLQYHLYAPVGPYRQDLTQYQRHVHDFFLRDDIREELQKKSEAARQVLPNSQLPSVGPFHTLVPLDTGRSNSNAKSFGNHVSWLFKATSKKDGHYHCLRRLQGVRLTNPDATRAMESWKHIRSANIVSVHLVFTATQFNDTSLVFVYDYHPLSKTLAEHHFPHGNRYRQQLVAEPVLWSYMCQLCSALWAIHSKDLAARCIDLNKVILTDKNRIRLGGCAIYDVLEYDAPRPLLDLQQEDLVAMGRLILSVGTNTPVLTNIQSSLEQFGRIYSTELQDRLVWLLTPISNHPQAAEKTVRELADSISTRMMDSFDSSLHANDRLTSELYKELENGRIVRLLMKLGTINERPEFDSDPLWAENGVRYPLKLFRDYVFHQVDANGSPVVDIGHMISCLNKLDAGTDERVYLTSRDHQTSFVITYRELKKAVASAFGDLLSKSQMG